MAGPTLKTFVHLLNPDTGQSEAFGPSSVLPAWAIAMITNPKAWAVPPEPAPAATKTPAAKPVASTPESSTPDSSGTGNGNGAGTPAGDKPKPPPKSGAGSGRDAWAEYATGLGADVDPKATREQIIAAVAEAGHPTE